MVGGIIPLRRAASFRFDGRLEQESAGWRLKSISGGVDIPILDDRVQLLQVLLNLVRNVLR
jgi:C4-dicarboxylate-specific signal transduction histidine kinase